MGEKRSHQHLQLLNSEGNENITVELLLFVDSLLTSEPMESQAGQTGGAYQKLLDVSHNIHLHNSALLERKLPCIRDVVCLQAEDSRLWDNYVSWILWDPVTQRTENPCLISSIFLKDHHTTVVQAPSSLSAALLPSLNPSSLLNWATEQWLYRQATNTSSV